MILIICNPASGGKRAGLVLNRFKLWAVKVQLDHTVYLTRCPQDYAGMREAYEKANPTMVVSCGGDGTANDVINGLNAYLKNTPFLILPAGSGNDYSRQVYGKLPPEKLFHLTQSQHFRHTDLGLCNDRWFLNGIGIGFDGSVARETHTNAHRLLPTTLKYYLAILKNVLFYKEFSFKTSSEGTSRKAFMLAVANGNCYGGGFMIAPRAVPDDGLLDVVEIGEISPLKRLFYIPVVHNGKHLHLEFVKHHQTTAVSIISTNRKPIPAHADGEIFESEKFDITLVKDALKIPVDSF